MSRRALINRSVARGFTEDYQRRVIKEPGQARHREQKEGVPGCHPTAPLVQIH